MTSWVYIFSKFTPEALLFEALAILLLICGYTAFWILRKRRFGVIDQSMPSGPIKSYLNELIGNAEQLRLQLFGLLASSDHSASQLYRLAGPTSAPNPGNPAPPSDPEIAKKLSTLETKVLEQLKALEAMAADKSRLERDLAEAMRGVAPAAAGSASNEENSGLTAKLQQKIQDLEGKLSEYSVIEDDLANLKRLQQENTLLKTTLTAKGIPIPLSGSPVLPSTAIPTQPPAATPKEASLPPPESAADVFAGLTGPVEDSLTAATATSAPPSEATDPPSPSSPVKNENEKAEADLVAEFEKMLQG